MSYSVDANVLIYAAQSDSPHHAKARTFLDRCAEGHESWYLAWPVLLAFLRITTHPALFRHPLTTARALADVESLLNLPHVRALGEDEGFWPVFREEAATLAVRGPLVTDAHVAALLKQHGVRVLYTNDADFRRFAFLEVRNPFA